MMLHETKRLAGVETDSTNVNPQGDQTESRAGHQPRRGIGGDAVNITEDVRKCAAEASGARQIIRRMTRRASQTASQQAISEEEALKRGMEEKSKEFVEAGAEVYAKA